MTERRRPPLTTVLRTLTRRDLMKLAPVAAVGAGAAGLALIGRSDRDVTSTTGTCRFCLMHCGVVAQVRDGRLVKVEGDLASRTRGFLCEHGFALREVVHSHARIRKPLLRRGDDFIEVSWDDALAEVAERLLAVKAKWGPQALLIQTGWPLVRHPLVNWLHRFARAFGTPNVASVASLCEASLRMGQALTVGTKYSPELRRVKTLAVWGANPWVTAPTFGHLVAAKRDEGNLFVIDPVKTALAHQATAHLQVRPGTDGLLALGMIRVVVDEGLYDAAFVARHTLGFDELVALARRTSLDDVSAGTTVPRALIERVARALANEGPSGIWQGLGVEHHEHGVQTVRAISALEVLVGRFARPPDGRAEVSRVTPSFADEMLPALYRMRTPEPVPPPVETPSIGHAEFPLYDMYNREAQGQRLAEAVLDDKPYPVRALVMMASNALLTSVGTQRLAQAAEKLELVVSIDPFLSYSAKRSDVVLPAATFAEAPDVDDDDTVAIEGMVPVQHDALTDWQILVALARAVGVGQYFPWASFAEAQRAPQVEWMRDEALQPKPAPQLEQPRFGTPTGKAEFTSTLLATAGHSSLPDWRAPTVSPSPGFPLWLVTGPRPRAYINSQFHGVPSMRARMREAEALMHPSAAGPLGIVSGQPVLVTSPTGAVRFRAVVTDDVHPEVVVVPAGFEDANANELIDPAPRDAISGFPAFRSGVCRVEPAR